MLDQHFIIVPSYRGQALVIGGKRYCSDGFFGDAFDGATDDALRLLYLAQDNFTNIDTNKITIYGVSRGGTVALLAGIRNPEIDFVIAQSGPTDFLSSAVMNRYGFQYRYQFLSHKQSMDDIRAKILRSSPVHFIDSLQSRLLLIHGIRDKVVPISNADQIAARLANSSKTTYLKREAGHQLLEIDFRSQGNSKIEVSTWTNSIR